MLLGKSSTCLQSMTLYSWSGSCLRRAAAAEVAGRNVGARLVLSLFNAQQTWRSIGPLCASSVDARVFDQQDKSDQREYARDCASDAVQLPHEVRRDESCVRHE